MARTFRAQALEDAFNRDGYLVLPFLAPADVEHLRGVFDRLYPDRRADFESTALNEPEDRHHLEAHRAIAPYVDRVADLFVDHQLVKGFFTCKRGGLPPENRSEVVLHQDLTWSDEPEVRGAIIWSPLVDVDPANGTLEVVPGSHRFHDGHRGLGMPWPFQDVEDSLRANLQPLTLRAGEMVVYDGGLIHCSARNTTAWDRPVVGLGLAHRGHRLIHLRTLDGAQVDTYEVEPDFYREHAHDAPPERWVRTATSAPLVSHRVTTDELADLLQRRTAGPASRG
ncbi:MAG: phytanoyl-CoA dioxygenase family protein [Acidimicrobiales bacterium]|nr:phytanoyl-CoA dioxygenase family protein [Acidimicrobiales bacterium]